MVFETTYKCLSKSVFATDTYKLVPIRYSDREAIRNWRNEQIDLLRQTTELTSEEQTNYFETVIANLFLQDKPKQLLFSFLMNNELIGYGGLVHIDWNNKNAEISFLTPKSRSSSTEIFENDWMIYLDLIKKVANKLNFIKIFTYAYSIRTNLFPILEKSNFVKEAVLKHHVIIQATKYDVVYHSYFCDELSFRDANYQDLMTYYNWTNDPEVRKYSYNSSPVSLESHTSWFQRKIQDPNVLMLIYTNSMNKIIGQVRIETTSGESIIGISIDKNHRGKGYASRIIEITSVKFKELNKKPITAYIKVENIASIKAFEEAGYRNKEFVSIDGNESIKLTYS